MGHYVKKIKLLNFCKFKSFEMEFNEDLNILIGDNEAGKSSVLNAIDFVISGSISKIESYGLDKFFNKEIIKEFLSGTKQIETLPKILIELYLGGDENEDLEGKSNSSNENTMGLRLECTYRDELSKEIKEILKQTTANFPFEYYSFKFQTFQGQSYTGYKKYLKHLLLDNTQINNEYAMRQYVKNIYMLNTEEKDRHKYQNSYRSNKDEFVSTELKGLNENISSDSNYSFSLRTGVKSNIETDINIQENGIDIETKGKGKQCFVKTDFALQKKSNELDVLLIEEPENHLSYVNMKKLIEKINDSKGRQLFITTHSSLIMSRLNLKKAIFLNSSTNEVASLKSLSKDTANFFMKAPDNNLLEYVLSKKNILVEGDAEFILMEKFFIQLSEGRIPELEDIAIISVNGLTFLRYLEVAKILKIKTAVITDNDGEIESVEEKYSLYQEEDKIKIFFSKDKNIFTFEIAIYEKNSKICDRLFSEGRKTLSVQQYMLKNKAESAFELLKNSEELVIPDYVEEAIQWIKE